MGSNFSPLDSGIRFLTAPAGPAYRLGARLYNYSEEQKARTSWALYKPSVILAYILQWASSLLWIMYLGMLAGIALTPVLVAGWPGGIWLAGVFFWRLGLDAYPAWLKEFGRIGKWTALAVTPHVLFLAVYNANTANGAQLAMDPLLKGCLKDETSLVVVSMRRTMPNLSYIFSGALPHGALLERSLMEDLPKRCLMQVPSMRVENWLPISWARVGQSFRPRKVAMVSAFTVSTECRASCS